MDADLYGGADEAAAQRAAEALRQVEEELAKLGRSSAADMAKELGLSIGHIEGMVIGLRDQAGRLRAELSLHQAEAARTRRQLQPAFDVGRPAEQTDLDRKNAEAAEAAESRRAAESANRLAQAFEKTRHQAGLTANQLAQEESARRQREKEERGQNMRRDAAMGLQSAASLGHGVMGLAQAGDPFSAFPTFTASVQGLSQAMGEAFIPSIEKASEMLQRMEQQFRGLSGETKGWVAFAGQAALAAVALAATGRVVVGVWTTLRGVLTFGGLLGPLGAVGVAVGGIAASVLALKTNAFGAGDALRAMGGAMGMPGTNAQNFIDRDALRKNLPDNVRKQIEAAGTNDAKIAEVINNFREKATKDLEGFEAAQPGQIARSEKAQKRFNELAKEQMADMEQAYKAEAPGLFRRMVLPGDVVAHERMEAAGRASGDAAAQIAAQLKKEGLETPLREIEAALNNALMKRMNPGQEFEFESPVTGQADRSRKERLEVLTRRKEEADALAEKTGADKFDMKRDTKLPQNFTYTGQDAFFQAYDRMQNAALNLSGQEKSVETLQHQLKVLEEHGGILRDIKAAIDNQGGKDWSGGPNRY